MKKILLAVIFLCPSMLNAKSLYFEVGKGNATKWINVEGLDFISYEYYGDCGVFINDPLHPYASVHYDNYAKCFYNYLAIDAWMRDYCKLPYMSIHYYDDKKGKAKILFFTPVKISD